MVTLRACALLSVYLFRFRGIFAFSFRFFFACNIYRRHMLIKQNGSVSMISDRCGSFLIFVFNEFNVYCLYRLLIEMCKRFFDSMSALQSMNCLITNYFPPYWINSIDSFVYCFGVISISIILITFILVLHWPAVSIKWVDGQWRKRWLMCLMFINCWTQSFDLI